MNIEEVTLRFVLALNLDFTLFEHLRLVLGVSNLGSWFILANSLFGSMK